MDSIIVALESELARAEITQDYTLPLTKVDVEESVLAGDSVFSSLAKTYASTFCVDDRESKYFKPFEQMNGDLSEIAERISNLNVGEVSGSLNPLVEAAKEKCIWTSNTFNQRCLSLGMFKDGKVKSSLNKAISENKELFFQVQAVNDKGSEQYQMTLSSKNDQYELRDCYSRTAVFDRKNDMVDFIVKFLESSYLGLKDYYVSVICSENIKDEDKYYSRVVNDTLNPETIKASIDLGWRLYQKTGDRAYLKSLISPTYSFQAFSSMGFGSVESEDFGILKNKLVDLCVKGELSEIEMMQVIYLAMFDVKAPYRKGLSCHSMIDEFNERMSCVVDVIKAYLTYAGSLDWFKKYSINNKLNDVEKYLSLGDKSFGDCIKALGFFQEIIIFVGAPDPIESVAEMFNALNAIKAGSLKEKAPKTQLLFGFDRVKSESPICQEVRASVGAEELVSRKMTLS